MGESLESPQPFEAPRLPPMPPLPHTPPLPQHTTKFVESRPTPAVSKRWDSEESTGDRTPPKDAQGNQDDDDGRFEASLQTAKPQQVPMRKQVEAEASVRAKHQREHHEEWDVPKNRVENEASVR